MATLAEIRAKLKEQESRTGGSDNRSGGDNAIYPFWNLKEGQTSTVRFLPDGDENNTFDCSIKVKFVASNAHNVPFPLLPAT